MASPRVLLIAGLRPGPQARGGLLSAVQRSAYFLALASGPAGNPAADAEYGGRGAFDDWAADGVCQVERSLGCQNCTPDLSKRRSGPRGGAFDCAGSPSGAY